MEAHGVSHREEVLDRAVGVEEGGAHGGVDISPCETHALHVRDGGLALVAHGQRGGIVELAVRRLLCGSR
jgi:hypothetical protein